MTEVFEAQYNLTEYKNFRTLELEYSKIKDQNLELKQKLIQTQQLYKQAINQSTLQQQQLIELIKQFRDNRQNYDKNRKSIENMLHKMNNVIISYQKLISEDSSQCVNRDNQFQQNNVLDCLQQMTKMYNKIVSITDCAYENHNNFIILARQNNQREQIWLQKQNQRSQQIAQLQLSLQKLSNTQNSLKIQNKRLYEYANQLEAQIKTYKTMAINARNTYNSSKSQTNNSCQKSANKNINKNIQEDTSFTLDLLSYQKQLLVRTFQLIHQSFHDQDIELSLKKIYEAYQDVVESYREKLQIQYDLEDLQCDYRKEQTSSHKGKSQQQQCLIELKKQINRFRKELQRQKEQLRKLSISIDHKEDLLQIKLKDLSGQSIYDHRLKNYTLDLQKRLRKQNRKQIINEQVSNEQQEIEQKGDVNLSRKLTATYLGYQQTVNTDKMMKDVIQKDRQNMEKILKETRSRFQKRY